MALFTHEFEAPLSTHGVGRSRVILKKALDAKPKLRAVWQRLTPGKRRGLAHFVAQAESSQTIQRRVRKVLDELVESR